MKGEKNIPNYYTYAHVRAEGTMELKVHKIITKEKENNANCSFVD